MNLTERALVRGAHSYSSGVSQSQLAIYSLYPFLLMTKARTEEIMQITLKVSVCLCVVLL